MYITRFLYLIFVAIYLQSCSGIVLDSKINGVSFVASSKPIDNTHIEPVLSVNANYAAIMPFAFIRELNNPEVIYNAERQWFGETFKGAQQYIVELKKKGIKVMMKPQIWVWRGEFTGYIKMNDEASWKQLEEGYTSFILDYAKLAEDTKCEILCIGTELEQFIENRPDFWKELIVKIKEVYNGKLTYAANWDEFKRTPFWDKLDYIGVDAYFPVSDSKTPTVAEAISGWDAHIETITNVSKTNNKPVLFTEFGYRSVDYAGKQPWVSDRSMNSVNLEAQTNTTQALFETFWNEPWFAGGFIWKWFHNHDKVGGEDNFMFTPQNKPVENLLRDHYGRYK
jgi:hypothetical protein